MELRTRLVLVISLASLVPLALLGYGANRAAGAILERKVSDVQSRTADGLAVFVDTWIGLQFRLIDQQLGSFEVQSLDDRTLTSFLRLVFMQTPEAHIISLTTVEGVDVAPSVFIDETTPKNLRTGMARDLVTPERFRTFRSVLPLEAIGEALDIAPDGATIGPQPAPSYRPAGRKSPVVPLAFPIAGTDMVLGVELGLDPIATRFLTRPGEQIDAGLIDRDGNLILGGVQGLIDPTVFTALGVGVSADEVRYKLEDGTGILAACAPVLKTGWMVVIAEPTEITSEAALQITTRTAYIGLVSALLSFVVGVLLSRQLSGPVVDLKDAALSVADGDLGRRVTPVGPVELRDLSRAFNFMSTSLQRKQERIERQSAEIEAFNQELQQRVEDRTRELRAAQDQLVQSARLAAVGEMGAGLAHELNNPLAGILGLTQVLVERHKMDGDSTMLRSIEEQAHRCREIVSHLLGFSREIRPQSPLEREDWDAVDLNKVFHDVLALMISPLRQRGVKVEHIRGEPLHVSGDRADLGRAFSQLLTSLSTTTLDGGSLQITGHRSEGEVRLEFALQEAEIVIGSDDWKASGMGFWAAKRVFAHHGGRLEEPILPKKSGKPVHEAIWKVILPGAKG